MSTLISPLLFLWLSGWPKQKLWCKEEQMLYKFTLNIKYVILNYMLSNYCFLILKKLYVPVTRTISEILYCYEQRAQNNRVTIQCSACGPILWAKAHKHGSSICILIIVAVGAALSTEEAKNSGSSTTLTNCPPVCLINYHIIQCNLSYPGLL